MVWPAKFVRSSRFCSLSLCSSGLSCLSISDQVLVILFSLRGQVDWIPFWSRGNPNSMAACLSGLRCLQGMRQDSCAPRLIGATRLPRPSVSDKMVLFVFFSLRAQVDRMHYWSRGALARMVASCLTSNACI